MNKSSITIIDDKNLRGIVAPASIISKEMLEDFVDLVGYANPTVVARVNNNFKKAKKLTRGREMRKALGV